MILEEMALEVECPAVRSDQAGNSRRKVCMHLIIIPMPKCIQGELVEHAGRER